MFFFFFSSRRRHTRLQGDWSSDVCSSDLGYNQAVEIARHLGRVDSGLCQRTRDAPPQIELPYAERQRNVRGAFRCTRALVGARVAVVDDVMTTGATLDEIARTLKAAGAVHVENWVVARTLPHV